VSWAEVGFDEGEPHGRRTGDPPEAVEAHSGSRQGLLCTARNLESMETSLLSARQIMLALPSIARISVARQAREESQRNGHKGG
jgi:hypothetical protein